MYFTIMLYKQLYNTHFTPSTLATLYIKYSTRIYQTNLLQNTSLLLHRDRFISLHNSKIIIMQRFRITFFFGCVLGAWHKALHVFCILYCWSWHSSQSWLIFSEFFLCAFLWINTYKVDKTLAAASSCQYIVVLLWKNIFSILLPLLIFYMQRYLSQLSHT